MSLGQKIAALLVKESPKPRVAPRRKPTLEALEGRLALSTVAASVDLVIVAKINVPIVTRM